MHAQPVEVDQTANVNHLDADQSDENTGDTLSPGGPHDQDRDRNQGCRPESRTHVVDPVAEAIGMHEHRPASRHRHVHPCHQGLDSLRQQQVHRIEQSLQAGNELHDQEHPDHARQAHGETGRARCCRVLHAPIDRRRAAVRRSPP